METPIAHNLCNEHLAVSWQYRNAISSRIRIAGFPVALIARRCCEGKSSCFELTIALNRENSNLS